MEAELASKRINAAVLDQYDLRLRYAGVLTVSLRDLHPSQSVTSLPIF